MKFKDEIKNSGFSLAEMMVVMLIVAVILAAMMPIMTKRNKTLEAPVTGEVPVGTIVSFYGTKAPDDNWLLCDNSTYNTSKYSKLYSILNSNRTPDLQGYFIRGLGGIDPDAATRKDPDMVQDSANKKHRHGIFSSNGNCDSNQARGLGNDWGPGKETVGVAGNDFSNSWSTNNTVVEGYWYKALKATNPALPKPTYLLTNGVDDDSIVSDKEEARPTNKAFAYIIKAK